MDFISPLPFILYRRRVYDTVLVVVYRYSKIARFIPYILNIKAPEIADLL